MNRRDFIRKAIAGGVFLASPILRAQPSISSPAAGAFNNKKKAAGGGGGGSNWSFITSGMQARTDANHSSTPARDTTGASLIVAVVECFDQASPTPTDGLNNGNFVKAASGQASVGGDGGSTTSIWICASPVTSSSHVITVTGTNIFASIAIYAFSGGNGGTVDKTSSAANNGFTATLQPGSITPSTNNQLIIAGCYNRSLGPATIDSGFATALSLSSENGASSYLIQTSAAAVNPTFTFGTANYMTAVQASI